MKKTIRRSFRILQKTYITLYREKKTLKSGSSAEWLLDNFYIFSQEYAGLKNIKFFGKTRRRAWREMFSLARAYLSANAYKLEESVLSDALMQNMPIPLVNLTLLPAAFSAALFSHAASLCASPHSPSNMGNVVKSLLSLRELDMKALYARHAAVDNVLKEDSVFAGMTFDSKMLYRKAVSRLSRLSRKSETQVAEAAVRLAANKGGKKGHAGYYFIAEGENELRALLGLKPKKNKAADKIYLSSLWTITLLLSFAVLRLTGRLFLSLITFLPLLDITASLLQYCLLKATPVRRIPRLAMPDGISEKVLIVYPTLLSSAKKAEEMAEKLEICYLANRDEHLHFAVLGDFKDSDSPDEDNEIPEACSKKIAALNEKYGNRFYMLCRTKTYAPQQKKWMGEERKRGALSDLNAFLRGEYSFRYTAGDTESLIGIRYVLTMDDDTLLPPGAAHNLIGTALHPLNKPTVKDGRVESGYGIIQPRISLRLESAGRSFFAKVYAGLGGTDTYQASTSEFYMDVFGESIFTGKGIYHVDIFRNVVSFPKDTILSHDLLEGSYVRCALASDVQVFDSFPFRFSDYSMRQHRWIRGDWQILPWLFPTVKNKEGKKVKNAVSLLSRWKIFDNLRRSLTPISIFILFATGGIIPTLIAFLSITLPLFLGILDTILQKRFVRLGEKRAASVICGMKSVLYQVTLSVVFLAHTAWNNLSAACIGFCRCFSHKNSLQWVTASDAEAGRKNTLRASFAYMLPSLLITLFMLFFAFSGLFTLGGLQFVFAAIWLFAPVLAYSTGMETPAVSYTLSEKNKAFLSETAERIWHFFCDYMTESEHYLPPDNVQVKPYKGIAHRTSPTNIGLGAIACLCACDLGFISQKEMENRIEKIMDTVEKLPTWNGHLYNWYDTRTLKPLSPRYISTVDSGNFACYLLTVAMGIAEYNGGETPLSLRLMHFMEKTDFRPLYNEKKKLFSIGFSPEENRLTDSYYDLLISEARQAGFLAICMGQIPPEHWFTLGRGLAEADGYRGMVSWSGTMFEYLMPLLIMQKYDNSLLSETYRFAILCQKKYGRRRRVPWGVSESGFFAFDNEGNFQYKAFGIPTLSLARQSPDDVVITPYASLLALMEDPKGAIANLHFMRKEGLYGEYGFFEAADYSPSRLTGNMRRGIVKSYMAHHQGMSLAAIANLLCENSLRRRFHAYPAVRSCEPLLKEKLPVGAAVIRDRHERISPVRFKWQTSAESVRTYENVDTFPRPVQFISNGSYHVTIDTKGRGRSSFDGIDLHTFSPFYGGGQNIWVLNPATGHVQDAYGKKCVFEGNTATFSDTDGAAALKLTVSVAPDENCEIRRLSLHNRSEKKKTYEIYYYAEPQLATEKDANAHPAFSKLFITTEEKDGTLYAKRRCRSQDEKTFTGFCTAIVEGVQEGPVRFDTDRLSFFGRNVSLPKTLSPGSIPGGKTGTMADSCFALKVCISVSPGMSASVTFLTGLSESEEKAAQLVRKYREALPAPAKMDNEFVFKEGEEAAFLHAAAFLLFGGAKQTIRDEARARNTLPRQSLWKLGISGDLPILTLRLTELADAPLLEEAVKAHSFFKSNGFMTDLAIFCDEAGGYTRPVFQMAKKMQKAGIFVFGRRELSGTDYDLLLSASALYIDKSSGGFSALPSFQPLKPTLLPKKNQGDMPLTPVSLLFDNGFGGFEKESGDYIIYGTHSGQTPLPWTHVVANEDFGFIAGESGSGYTWSGNCHTFRLSPWTNDPVRDPLYEWLTLKEDEDIWSPMAGVFPEEGIFRTRYGAGFVTYERCTRQLMHSATLFVPRNGKKKIILLKIKNLAESTRTVGVRYSFCPVLGTHPVPASVTVLETGHTVRLRNALTDAAREVYLTASPDANCGKDESEAYASLFVTLKADAEETVVFTLGEGKPENQDAAALLQETKAYWESLLQTVTVETEDVATNLLLNRWLLYQALACRLFARTGFYQSGGAFGFRDQLQDVLALLYCAPALARKQILLHAAHQFTEGDAFHWWHNDERGVRTRFSDDRLFLPFVTCIYAEETGDTAIWDMTESFVEEPPLNDDEEERYTFVKSRTAPHSIYEHSARAIDISLQKGTHGLPLMGGGDWNDGMNAIGIGGQGESVWLCWFVKTVLDKFAPIAEARGDTARAARYRRESALLLEAAESEAFSGTHYARAFFDDGTPLGTAASEECAIDAISQAWAVIAGGARHDHLKSAMEQVYSLLTDHENALIRLLTPPFETSTPSPGYIQSYPKGIRENGGQYTHGVIWAVMAFAILEDKEKAWSLFRMLNPILHTDSPDKVQKYKGEPFVMAADIYTAPGLEGRMGWSWYTGAAAWMYRLGIRYMLGFQKKGNMVSFSPSMPLGKNGFTLRYRFGTSLYIFHVHGKSDEIVLVDDGKTHEMTL